MKRRRDRRVPLGALVLAGWLPVAVAGVEPEGEWRTYGGDLASTKYSPLSQINGDNFAALEIAWRWRSVDGRLTKTTASGGEWQGDTGEIFEVLDRENPDRWRAGQVPRLSGFKATPLMVEERLFLNTPLSQGAAIDARTGETLWVYNPKSYEEGTTTMSARWNQRGVAYWSDGSDERVLWGTGNGYLICVFAETGRPCEDFGDGGHVDLMEGIPRAVRGGRDWLNALLYSVQSPPIVVGDTVVTPMSISSYNNVKEMPPGWLRGFDVRTGALRWTFHTIPQAGEPGNETWSDGSWRHTGKVGVWTMMSADEELGYLYVPTNTSAPDFYGGHRLGDNLYAESLLCLDAETGERVWHFQMVHHGVWDYDNPAAPNLLDVRVDGRDVKAVAQVTKQGFVYVFDRVSGEPIWPIEERAVATDTDLVGEVLSPTQPFPTKPLPFEAQGTSVEDLVDFTPEIRRMAVEAVRGYRLGPLFSPQTLAGTLMRPSTGGGANWAGAGVDPETGILYVPSRNRHSVLRYLEPRPDEGANLRYLQARGRGLGPQMPDGLPLWKPPYSRMTAIDMNTGEHVWMQPLGNGDDVRGHPLLADLDLPPLGGSTLGGPLVTKTLLIGAVSDGGSQGGPSLVARDKKTGEILAAIDLPGGAMSTPMTYLLDGRQYLALVVAAPVPELIALRLP
ncbi:MAG: pyrroloquinoline quinone-dependent dehydrogenase [Acidobacteriota bacterium]|nr:pyrroloquinoline quinone-dependent dehydrogenase [Acidobacteriota bacterium]